MFFKKPLVQLPCRRHRGCTSHKYWQASQTTPVESKDGNATRTHITSPTREKAAPIQSLPTEILIEITEHLSPLEQICLALTCRSLASILGTELRSKSSKTGPASWFHHAEMLDILQKDMDSCKYWRCGECNRFHLRKKMAPADNPSTPKSIAAIWHKNDDCLEIGISGDYIYTLYFELVNTVMDQHFLGQGVCLQTMRCQGYRSWEVSPTMNMVLDYKLMPKIVLDRLLLQSTYTFKPEATMYVQNLDVAEFSIPDFLEQIEFWICKHENTGRMVRYIDEQPHSGRVRTSWNFKCTHCPTQYKITYGRQMMEIVVWQNFGSGRNRRDAKWMSISKADGGSSAYEWGQENVAEAFERVMCSTEDEFRRQLERSDGAGSWYDPELKRRSYKTLPEKMLGRL